MDLYRKAITVWQSTGSFLPPRVTESDPSHVRKGARPTKAWWFLPEFSCKAAAVALECGGLPLLSPASRDSLLAVASGVVLCPKAWRAASPDQRGSKLPQSKKMLKYTERTSLSPLASTKASKKRTQIECKLSVNWAKNVPKMRKERQIELKERRIEGAQDGVPCVQTLACMKVTERLTNSPIPWPEATDNSSESNERTGNVYENKGTIRKSHERSWNVYENK